MLPLVRAALLAASVGGVANAQEQSEAPPIPAPVFEPVCTQEGLVAAFYGCAMVRGPSSTIIINGEPAITIMSQGIGCGWAYATTESSIDQLSGVLLGNPANIKTTLDKAKAAMRDPIKHCPALAAF